MLVIVAGCGRLGRHVAEALFEVGNDVMVIDHSPEALENLSDSFTGFTLLGDATELENLRASGINRADALVACTGNDEVNLLVAELARRIYKVPRVIIRAVDPLKDEFFEQLGYETVSPLLIGARAILDALRSPDSGGEG